MVDGDEVGDDDEMGDFSPKDFEGLSSTVDGESFSRNDEIGRVFLDDVGDFFALREIVEFGDERGGVWIVGPFPDVGKRLVKVIADKLVGTRSCF